MAKEKHTSFEEFSKNRKVSGRSSGRSSGRGFDRRGSRQNVGMTKVTCSTCKAKCEVPFKPTSSKPVYCNDCFIKKGSQGKVSKEDLDTINEKLDKIMKLLEKKEEKKEKKKEKKKVKKSSKSKD